MVSPTIARPVATRRWSLRRTHVVVSTVATVTAVWLGLTAPSISPVTPAGPPAVTAAVTTTDDAAVAPAPVVTPAPVVVPGPRGGRGRR